MQVVVDGLITNYQLIGKGKALLLLHGWGDSSIGLKNLTLSLSDEYKVIAVDLPGFGGTQSPREVWGLDDYAIFVSNFIKKIDIEPYAIIGHSNGGAIAIRGLVNNLKSNKLILLASAGIRGEYKGRIKALRYATKAGKFIASPLPSRLKKRLRSRLYSTVGSDMLVAEHLQETFKKIVEDDVREDAKKISQPTLLIYGSEDISTPLKYGQLLASKINNSKLEVIKNAGHMLTNENTEELSLKIKEFLNA